MKLENKVVIVTGGSKGLGLAITKKLVAEGAKVHIFSRNIDKQQQVISEHKLNNAFPHSVDITNQSQVNNEVEGIAEVDILINNAGVWLEGALTDNTIEEIDKTIDVNVKGVIYTSKAVMPTMLAKDDGFIVNVSSTSGLKGRPKESIYVASKYAVRGFTDSLKEELKATNVKVAGLYPGGMKTGFFQEAGYPKENDDWMDPEKVADIVIFVLKQDDTMILDHVVVNKRKTKLAH